MTPPDARLVALYARVSSDRQDVDLSVAAQLRALRDYAAKHGYVVAREYVGEVDEHVPLTVLEVVSDGHRILVRRSDERLIGPRGRQSVLRLPLADLLAEIEQKVASAPLDGVNWGVEGIRSIEILP